MPNSCALLPKPCDSCCLAYLPYGNYLDSLILRSFVGAEESDRQGRSHSTIPYHTILYHMGSMPTILTILTYLPYGISLDSRILRFSDPVIKRKNLIGMGNPFLNYGLMYHAMTIFTILSYTLTRGI